MAPHWCDVRVGNRGAQARHLEPVTVGIPLPQGLAADPADLRLHDAAAAPVPVQARALDRWPDGSLRWALVDFQAECAAAAEQIYRLSWSGGPHAPRRCELHLTEDGEVLRIDTGAARFAVSTRGGFPFADARTPEGVAVDPDRTRLVVEDSDGRVWSPVVDAITVEEHGPIRLCLRVAGRIGGRRPLLQLVARLHFFAGSPTVKFVVTVRNPRAARHPGGTWELGSRGSVYLRDMSFVCAPSAARPADPPAVRCSAEIGAAAEEHGVPFELYQDSSGGANWDSLNHVNRHGRVPNRVRGYVLSDGPSQTTGLRATPAVTVAWGAQPVSVAAQYFWQEFPKAIRATGTSLALGLFPRQYADLHEIQGGEQKTHTFHVAFGRDTVTATPLDWSRAPLFVRTTADWYCGSGAVPYLTPAADDPHSQYLQLVAGGVEGSSSFFAKRELIDEYGWRHFGDLYADHEAVFHSGERPLISHYNNQYDAAAGMACQFMRTGDERWWTLFRELTTHVEDIDIYHTDRDKSAYNGGLFWHTFHYVDAGRSSHRSYPARPGVWGGGPSNEHNYSTGLMLRYFLTGDAPFRDAAIGLADWVINMDDGRRTVFRWIDRGPTGVASATGSPLYQGPGRGAAYSITSLLNAHRLTGAPTYLAKAEALIRRCIHPHDDIEARNLLDAERRWYYTVFLQALGHYLDYKIALGQFDTMYAYARASLLAYARWMADHEYPYLTRPEILEYPTETWAALDMRKAEVLDFASAFAADAERERFRARAEFFFQYSTSTLSGMPTRTLTRPIVLMLSNGYMHAWFKRRSPASAPTGPALDAEAVGAPTTFLPQKARVRGRIMRIAAAVLTAAALGSAAATVALLRR